ncbi:MAG: hypothetical protein TREMPRED_001477 [Tremellales sp. Tagirdzhanova-0007]|nr:MAG: hypothetical protein TREMPRED_001477 [Tremellales sp. Tagirdzhanova-0007]
MSGQPSSALAAHLINQTLSSVALLESLSLINPNDAQIIRSKLPSPSGPFPSHASPPQPELSNAFNSLNVSGGGVPPHGRLSPYGSDSGSIPSLPPRGKTSQSPETRARALWDYHGTEGDDLAFKAGDTIMIDEEVNEQWYRGRVVPQGQMYPLDRSGLFPSNYVEKSLPSKSRPYYPTSPPPIGPQAVIHYQAPYIQQPYHDQMPQMMHGQAYTVTSPPQAPSGLTSMDQQQDDRKKKYGKLGGQLQTAAINGAGFGFGAALAGDLVNKIF